MPLDPHAKRFLALVAAGAGPQTSEPSPLKQREAMLQLSRAVDAKNVPIGALENRDVPGPGGPMAIRVYTPIGAVGRESAGIVYFHGGMGVFCDLETHDGLCRMLANGSECRVISVDYRLAPEHKFPAALEDSWFATRWVCEHAPELGIDPARIVVAGDSAGATLAAVVCQLAKQAGGPRLALQVLICPVTDLAAEAESRKTYATGYFVDAAAFEWSKSQYVPAGERLDDERISPLRARDFAALPPAHIHTAEFDPVRDEGEAYGDALARAGVSVRYVCHPGMIHHFYCMAGVIPYARDAIANAGVAIREAIAVR